MINLEIGNNITTTNKEWNIFNIITKNINAELIGIIDRIYQKLWIAIPPIKENLMALLYSGYHIEDDKDYADKINKIKSEFWINFQIKAEDIINHILEIDWIKIDQKEEFT